MTVRRLCRLVLGLSMAAIVFGLAAPAQAARPALRLAGLPAVDQLWGFGRGDGIAHARAAAAIPPGLGTGSAYCAQAHPGGYQLGANFENVFACGPVGPFSVPPFEQSAYGFQCVELAERFMWDLYKVSPVFGADLVGGIFVLSVHAANPSKLVGTSGTTTLPVAGDIISMWGGSSHQSQSGSNSHVAIVTGVTGSTTSGWTINVMEENGSSTGWNTIAVSPSGASWSYDSGYFTSFDWLLLGDHQKPTQPTNLQLTSLSGNPQATLTWGASTDSGGSNLAGYNVQLNGGAAQHVGATSTSLTFMGLNCAIPNSFSVTAVDGAGNQSTSATLPNQILSACLHAQALNKIVSVTGGASYYDDSAGLHYLDDQNTYWCLVDKSIAVYTVATQSIANILGNGKPWYPECLSVKRAIGHTVRNSATGAAYVVIDNGTAHGLWHWEPTGSVYNCLIGSFPRLDADTTEIESLRGSGFYDGTNADCPPATPASLAVSGSSQTSLSISWQRAANDDNYTVLLNGSPVATQNGTSFTFSGLDCSSNYTLGVRATNTVGLTSTATSLVKSTSACPPKYTLSISLTGSGSGSVNSSPGSISCGGSCSAQFTQGTVVTLNANVPGGSAFWAWSGGCGGSGSTCTVTMNGNVSVTANFAATYTIQSRQNGKFVSAEIGYGGGDYGLLRARTASPSLWERFVIVGNCSNACGFISLVNRLYVSAELGYSGNSYGELRARSSTWGGWETFHVVGNWSVSCAIVSNPNGRYVSAELADPGGYYARLRARSTSWGGWESYKIVRG